jgi:transposase-like protein
MLFCQLGRAHLLREITGGLRSYEGIQLYRKVYPRAVKRLESDIENLLSFNQVNLSPTERKGRSAQELQKAQEALWRRIRTTNPIERVFCEVRRRTKPMDVFNNRNRMERILFAVFFHLNSKG